MMARAETDGAALAARLEVVLRAHGLPTSCAFGAEELVQAALHDKKRRNQTIHLITVPILGNGVVTTVPISELKQYVQKGVSV